MKKLKKEIGDKSNASIKFLRQLLPLPKVMREVIVTEPFGTINDGKGRLLLKSPTKGYVRMPKKTLLRLKYTYMITFFTF